MMVILVNYLQLLWLHPMTHLVLLQYVIMFELLVYRSLYRNAKGSILFCSYKALAVGSDSNGSGVVALLEIARLFSRLYSNPITRGRYNLLFGLTSGGPYNYNGTMKVTCVLIPILLF